jgi:iron complex outermembrane receptor protein
MNFAIEYKAKEPRARITLTNAARTLLAIQDMEVDNVGIVMDLGHSLMAKETPAEELQWIARRGKLRSVEVNDNWRDWDDDMTVGSVHLLETIEFLIALRYSRKVKSGFAEANYEVIYGLNVNAAARYEDYGGFHTTAPKLAVNWRIVPQVAIRGSVSRAYQAPSINNSANVLISSGVAQITDPLDGTTTFRSVATYGNPKLKPQTADVFNIGATFLALSTMRPSVDSWKFKYKNQIELQGAQSVILADPTGPEVIRDQTTNTAQTINVTSFNAPSGTATSGIDVAASYAFDVGVVGVTLRDSLTYLLKYDVDIGGVVYDGVGYRNNFLQSPGTASAAPRWRSVAGIDLAYRRHSLSGTWRYTSGVRDDYGVSLNTSGTGPLIPNVPDWIKAFSVFDFQYSVKLGEDDRYDLALGMINAFDTAPGFAKFNGYLPSISDAFGRQIYARVGARF